MFLQPEMVLAVGAKVKLCGPGINWHDSPQQFRNRFRLNTLDRARESKFSTVLGGRRRKKCCNISTTTIISPLSVQKTTSLVAALGPELYIPTRNWQKGRKMIFLDKLRPFFNKKKIGFITANIGKNGLKMGQISVSLAFFFYFGSGCTGQVSNLGPSAATSAVVFWTDRRNNDSRNLVLVAQTVTQASWGGVINEGG